MSYLIEKMILSDNLYWAWEKTASEYRSYGGWYDEVELESFGANIEKELQVIATQFQKLDYKMLSLRPVLYPKKPDDKDMPQSRQWFWVPIRNQVAWIAFVNIIGPFLDYRMPNWSYGNRLYRPIWYESEAGGKRVKKIGWYRNTSNKLYKHFNQSWNVYRRNIFYTVCNMTTKGNEQCLSQEEKEELKQEELLPDTLKLSYLRPDYWKRKSEKIYWLGIDFEKFYPSINLDVIRENVKKFMPRLEMSEDLNKLLGTLLTFPIDLSGCSVAELSSVYLDQVKSNIECVPTGLFVAGFLANVSMMGVDDIVKKSAEENQIAHFKYVDDHIILAQDFEKLLEWKKDYEEILKENVPSVKIKIEKIKPDNLRVYFESNSDDRIKAPEIEKRAKKDSELDPRFPTPLMTKTLEHISGLADLDPDLLDENEQRRLLGDLEHLLLSDFPDNELREDTRVSFAASMISRVAKKRFPHLSKQNVYFLDRDISKLKIDLKLLKDKKISRLKGKDSKQAIKQQIQSLIIRINKLENQIVKANAERIQNENDEKERIFFLLLKALEEHPEKVKIWARVFQYCQYVGYGKLRPIFHEYNRLSKNDKLNISYYRALILQILADQLISCTRTILNKDELFYRRQASLTYLINVIKELDSSNLYKEANQKYYEISARHLFECAIGTMRLSLTNLTKYENDLVSSEDLRRIKTLCDYYHFTKWTNPDQWVRKKAHTLSEWVWWAENKITDSVSFLPGIVWKTTVGLLDVKDPVSWTLWEKYPSLLGESDIAIKKIIKSFEIPKLKIIQSNEAGWLLDVLSSTNNKQDVLRLFGKKRSPTIDKVVKALTYEKKDYINLFEWVNGLQQLYDTNPFNTRLSEWTALKITKKICLLVNTITGSSLKKTINPANFLLPKKWLDEMPDSWKDWGKILEEGEVCPSHELIEDGRYTPIFLGELSDVEYAPVRGMSLLMLGLLTRSFKLPSIWNPQGQRLARNNVLKRMIGNCKCSSWTSAILWGCFLPKVRETVLFEPLQDSIFSGLSPSVDTTIDPPRVIDLNRFIKYIDLSIAVLEKYQISAYQNKPMQLTPINVEQLTQNAFND